MSTRLLAALLFAVLIAPALGAEEEKPAGPPPAALARTESLGWLRANANEDGSWGGPYSVAVTALGALAHLAATDEPFEGERARPLLRAVEWLLSQAKEGVFPAQGHTWIHGQGYGSLALSETLVRALLARTKPDLDLAALRARVAATSRVIAERQSASGGWWYHPDSPGQHEGSTTVCAVQALVSARNAGISVDEAVLDRGFEYLKRCQNRDGGFDYMEGPGENSMKEGTAAGIATLALMRRFDYEVMIRGCDFVKRVGAAGLQTERFQYYGWFYAVMGLTLFGEEMGAEADATAYAEAVRSILLGWKQADGSFPRERWMAEGGGEGIHYATAWAALILSVPDARLTIFRRAPPELPAEPAAPAGG
jgi:hypothetical protein